MSHLSKRNEAHIVLFPISLTPRTLFLFDAIGALSSAVWLGVILPSFQEMFGAPLMVLYGLAILASLFFIFSGVNYLIQHKHHKDFLKGVAIVNLVYCVITAAVMIVWQESLTPFGNLYFVIEIVLILALVRLELKAANEK